MDRPLVSGSEATLEASVVRLTQQNAYALARGVNAQADLMTSALPTLFLQHSLVEQNHQFGIFVTGGQATIEASVVRATELNGMGRYGRSVHVQAHPTTGAVATLLMERSLVDDSREGGVFVIGSDATIASCLLRNALPNADSRFGDGVAVVSEHGPASATITATRIEQSARAAVAAWGSEVAIGGSAFSCQGFDIDYEIYEETAARLDDLGGNLCGCPEPTAPCLGVSANLEPPSLVEPETP